MPVPGWALYNLRIDTRGHVLAVEIRHYEFVGGVYTRFWKWYDLDGLIIESGSVAIPPGTDYPQLEALRIDTRGHVREVMELVSGVVPHWYDLDGTDLGAGALDSFQELQIDTRGHVLQVEKGGIWYDLNGDVAA